MTQDELDRMRHELSVLKQEIKELRELVHENDTTTLNRLHSMDLQVNNLESRINEFRPVVRGYYGLVALIVSTVGIAMVKMLFGNGSKP